MLQDNLSQFDMGRITRAELSVKKKLCDIKMLLFSAKEKQIDGEINFESCLVFSQQLQRH
jgi:hypothetical protein